MSRQWSDVDVARAVSTILRGGLLLAALVTAAGGFLYLRHHRDDRVDYRAFHGQAANLHSIGGILHGAASGEAQAIIQLGLLLLIATPIARVALSLLGFYLERDWRYIAITGIVLAILMVSLFGRV